MPFIKTSRLFTSSVRAAFSSTLISTSVMGLRSLAVPLFNAQGQVQAALNVGVHAGQMTAREMIERVLPELQKAARELTLLLR